MMAASIIIMSPTLILFFFTQKHLLKEFHLQELKDRREKKYKKSINNFRFIVYLLLVIGCDKKEDKTIITF